MAAGSGQGRAEGGGVGDKNGQRLALVRIPQLLPQPLQTTLPPNKTHRHRERRESVRLLPMREPLSSHSPPLITHETKHGLKADLGVDSFHPSTALLMRKGMASSGPSSVCPSVSSWLPRLLSSSSVHTRLSNSLTHHHTTQTTAQGQLNTHTRALYIHSTE